MTILQKRLLSCFQQVFPNLTEMTVQSASEDTLVDWDSVHVISLVLAVEKEFNIHIKDSDLSGLTSFWAFEFLLRNQA
jgi:acyl carrier protein